MGSGSRKANRMLVPNKQLINLRNAMRKGQEIAFIRGTFKCCKVCLPAKTDFFVFCQRLVIRRTRRCTCRMCICVGRFVFLCVNNSRFYFMGLPAQQRVQTSRHLGNIWSKIKVAQTENTTVLAVGNTLLILSLIPNNERRRDSVGHLSLCFLFWWSPFPMCCCHLTSCDCPIVCTCPLVCIYTPFLPSSSCQNIFQHPLSVSSLCVWPPFFGLPSFPLYFWIPLPHFLNCLTLHLNFYLCGVCSVESFLPDPDHLPN